MNKTAKVLTRARELLETKSWTKYRLARDEFGHPAAPSSEHAVCFCISGAMQRAFCDMGLSWADAAAAWYALEANLPVGSSGIIGFNDAQESPGPVLALLTRAIEAELKL